LQQRKERDVVSQPPIARGFRGRRQEGHPDRLPPGQYLTAGFPVLSAGPTPHTDLANWSFSIYDRDTALVEWSWFEFEALPQTSVKVDIHCVTKWSKLDTHWQGVTVDMLLDAAGLSRPTTPFAMIHSDGDYSTNIPVQDLIGDKAMVATRYEGEPLSPEHGGPARLLVPHLYFWKSAKWVRCLQFITRDEPGFWEQLGYHMYGDPWREQRYAGD
jgi:DMSO/TMAO reductase YedYZ molybdopterin-dependent catalytic subunit